MRIASLIAGSVLAAGMMAATAAPSDAAPRLPHVTGQSNTVTQIRDRDDDRGEHRMRGDDDDHGRRHNWWRWRHREMRFDGCRETRRECAERFGWGTWRFERCVDRRGC